VLTCSTFFATLVLIHHANQQIEINCCIVNDIYYAHQKVRTAHVSCMQGNHIRGDTNCSIRLSSHICEDKIRIHSFHRQCSHRTGYHPDDITTCEYRVDFLPENYQLKCARKVLSAQVLTLNWFPCICNSSFIPDTYALLIFERSRSCDRLFINRCSLSIVRLKGERITVQFVKY
jgi:hypothetical protein